MATFVFNPNYYTISGVSGSKATVKVTSGSTSYSFDVPLRNGGAKVYLSKIFQLFFTDPETTRTKTATLYVNNVSRQTYNLIYGSIDPDHILSTKHYVRWFTNFPMEYKFFSGNGFHELSSLAANTYVKKNDDSRVGIFLKWIDCMGQTFTFLFTEGMHTIKTNDSKMKPIEFDMSGHTMEFERPMNRTSGRTITCAACNLTQEERKYVTTIAKSIYAYMYVESTWVPIIIEAGSFKYMQNEELTDFEITVRIPDAQPMQP